MEKIIKKIKTMPFLAKLARFFLGRFVEIIGIHISILLLIIGVYGDVFFKKSSSYWFLILTIFGVINMIACFLVSSTLYRICQTKIS